MIPPHLYFQGDTGRRCKICNFYDGRGRCLKYDALVTEGSACDSFVSIFSEGHRQIAEP